MKVDRTIEDDGAIKITMRQGHLKLVGWVSSWHLADVKEAQMKRLFELDPPHATDLTAES